MVDGSCPGADLVHVSLPFIFLLLIVELEGLLETAWNGWCGVAMNHVGRRASGSETEAESEIGMVRIIVVSSLLRSNTMGCVENSLFHVNGNRGLACGRSFVEMCFSEGVGGTDHGVERTIASKSHFIKVHQHG